MHGVLLSPQTVACGAFILALTGGDSWIFGFSTMAQTGKKSAGDGIIASNNL